MIIEYFYQSLINMHGFKRQLVDIRSVIFHGNVEYSNHGQNNVDKFTKLSKIGFYMEFIYS